MLLPWTLLRCVLMLASSKTTWCFFEFERFLNPPKPKHASDSLILLTFVRIPVTLGMTGRHKASKLMRHWRHRAKLHNLNPMRQGEVLWTLARKTRQELRQRREKVVKRLEEIDRGDFGSFGRDYETMVSMVSRCWDLDGVQMQLHLVFGTDVESSGVHPQK